MSFGTDHSRAPRKLLGRCGQANFARLGSSLDNYLGQAIEHTSLPFRRRRFARETQAYPFVNATRTIAIVDCHGDQVVACMKKLPDIKSRRSFPIMGLSDQLAVHIHPAIIIDHAELQHDATII
jgi:hypothetical protein